MLWFEGVLPWLAHVPRLLILLSNHLLSTTSQGINMANLLQKYMQHLWDLQKRSFPLIYRLWLVGFPLFSHAVKCLVGNCCQTPWFTLASPKLLNIRTLLSIFFFQKKRFQWRKISNPRKVYTALFLNMLWTIIGRSRANHAPHVDTYPVIKLDIDWLHYYTTILLDI